MSKARMLIHAYDNPNKPVGEPEVYCMYIQVYGQEVYRPSDVSPAIT